MNTRKTTATNTYSITPATCLYSYDLNSIEKLKKIKRNKNKTKQKKNKK